MWIVDIRLGPEKLRADELPIKEWASVDITHEERMPKKYFLTFSVRQKVLWECENPDPKELPNVDIRLGPAKCKRSKNSTVQVCCEEGHCFGKKKLTLTCIHPKSENMLTLTLTDF